MAEINDNTKNFIDQLSQGKNDEAGEAFKASLRDKVANSLDNARKDLAGNLFTKPVGVIFGFDENFKSLIKTFSKIFVL